MKKAKSDYRAKNFLFIAVAFYDDFSFTENAEIYNKIFERLSRENIKSILIVNSVYEHINTSHLNTETITIPYFCCLWYLLLIQRKQYHVSSVWNDTATKFLVLTGKSYKFNRIRLVWLLQQQSLLQKSIWSLHVHDWTETKKFLPELDDKDFDAFVSAYSNNPDNINIMGQMGSYPGNYDVSLFDNTLFRLISETTFKSVCATPYFTEKTYLTMFNKLPFIIAGDVGSCRWLKSNGYKTYEEYLPIANYDDIVDPHERLNAVISNSKYWLESMQHKEHIKQDVEHNFQQAIKQGKTNCDKITHTLAQYDSDATVEDCLINPDWPGKNF